MSNDNWWKNEEPPPRSTEDATRAVSHSELMASIAPSQYVPPSLKAETQVANEVVQFQNQDPTRAISAQFFQQSQSESFTSTADEEATRALNLNQLNAQLQSVTSQFGNTPSQPSSTQSPFTTNQTTQAAPYSYPNPLTTSPATSPATSPYQSNLNAHYPQEPPRHEAPRHEAPSYHYPSPVAKSNSTNPNTEHLSPKPVSQVPASPQERETEPSIPNTPSLPKITHFPSPLAHSLELNSNSKSASIDQSQEDLTQAHLKSEALANLLNHHREAEHQASSSDGKDGLDLHNTHYKGNKRRAKVIVYSSIMSSILIILIALVSQITLKQALFSETIEQQQIQLTQLEAKFAQPWLESSTNKDQLVLSQEANNQVSNLYAFLNSTHFTLQSPDHEFVYSLSENSFKSQAHPLRLNGGFLPQLSFKLESDWLPKESDTSPLKLFVAGSASLSVGEVFDILTTMSIVAQRKRLNLDQYALMIEQKSVLTQTPLEKQKQAFASLPFQLLVDSKQLNQDDLLQISWSPDQKNVRLRGPKSGPSLYRQIMAKSSHLDEEILLKEAQSILRQVSGLKGIILSPPRSISLTEISLWLSVCSPYPIYVLPPKVTP